MDRKYVFWIGVWRCFDILCVCFNCNDIFVSEIDG